MDPLERRKKSKTLATLEETIHRHDFFHMLDAQEPSHQDMFHVLRVRASRSLEQVSSHS